MPTEKILAIVEKYAVEYNATCRKFRSDSSRYEIDAIGVRVYSVNDAVQFLKKGIDISKAYYISCETIINSVDEICRPLLSENPKPIAIVAVADLLGKIVKDMKDNSTSFDLAINGIDVGYLGEVKPEPSIVSSIVHNFWKDKLMLLPDAADAKKEYAKYLSDKKRSAEKAEEEAKKVAAENEKIAKEEAKVSAKVAKNAKSNIEKRYAERAKQYDHTAENNRIQELKSQEEAFCNKSIADVKASAQAYSNAFMNNLDGFIKKEKEQLKAKAKQCQKESKKLSKEEKLKAAEKVNEIKWELKAVSSKKYKEYQISRCRENIKAQTEDYERDLNAYINGRFEKTVVTHKLKSLYTDNDVDWASWSKEEIAIMDKSYGWQTIYELDTFQGVLNRMMRRNAIKMMEKDGDIYYALYDADDIVEEVIWKDKKTTAPQPPAFVFSEDDYCVIGSRYMSMR